MIRKGKPPRHKEHKGYTKNCKTVCVFFVTLTRAGFGGEKWLLSVLCELCTILPD
jgi:hypothetical protein